VTLHLGDCLAWLATLDAESVDAIVTDPPYELTSGKKGGTGAASLNVNSPAGRSRIGTGGGFMGKAWDATGIAHSVEFWAACFRVLKPGGHLVAFGGTRTSHRLTVAVEDAGFEIRDSIGWVYYSGFPKSLDVSKALDSAAGAVREVVGTTGRNVGPVGSRRVAGLHGSATFRENPDNPGNLLTAPATPDAVAWSGYGTALKPATEPAVLARKPLGGGTVAANVLRFRTGALNIDGCRFAPGDPAWVGPDDGAEALADKHESTRGLCSRRAQTTYSDHDAPRIGVAHTGGRWPANLYYCPKSPRAERERGTDGLPYATPPAVEAQGGPGKAGLNSPRSGAGRSGGAVGWTLRPDLSDEDVATVTAELRRSGLPEARIESLLRHRQATDAP
jgi:site-specific DNA-methyltransferase (adenine-specific)